MFSIYVFWQRSGEDIYAALLGKPETNCVRVLHYHDQVPIEDFAMWLHMQTCEEEMQRIIESDKYTVEEVLSSSPTLTNFPNEVPWFNPKSLGDTILKYSLVVNDDTRYLFVNTSMTEAYCVDINI